MTEQTSDAARATAEPDPEAQPEVTGARQAIEAELAEAKDRMLRTLAEMENLRRRTDREIADTKTYAVASFARDMLTVADNLKRAIAAVPADARAADAALSNLMDGVEATERGLEQTLTKFGIRPIDAKGQKFDPKFHQAMYEVPGSDLPPGSVAEVVQPGYRIGERVLRPALVAVVGGQPAAPKPANDAAPAAPESAPPG